MNIKLSIIFGGLALIGLTTFTACEKDLKPDVYDQFTPSTFYKDGNDVKAALTAAYNGLMTGGYAGWGSGNGSWHVQNSMTTDELVCSWGWDGWKKMNDLNFAENFGEITGHYTTLIRKVSECTIFMDKAVAVTMDATLKARYIAEAKALRAHFTQILYSYYGPVPIVVDPKVAQDPLAPAMARPTDEWMVTQIEKDYKEAAAALPASFTGSDYGRFSQAAALTGLMKLYMQKKRWADAVTVGQQLLKIGDEQNVYALQPKYADIFKITNKGNKEIILAIPCRNDADQTNMWLAHVLQGDYFDPAGQALTAWGGYKMPWKTYDKFDPKDNRLTVLLRNYPTGKNGNGELVYKDAKAAGLPGALPIKYSPDPAASGESQGNDMVVWRYADVLLLLSEAINETSGPVNAAIDLLNRVHERAGLTPFAYGSLTQSQLRSKLQDERLFELWTEGSRRDDLIRWGLFVQRARAEGSPFADTNKIFYPIPRPAIDESGGKIKQNTGY
ncbi:RagB/SusD family nutrient uptake outer membrane protein [Chitinophaga sp. 22321]|uniref:RagB/SusD family nutrient uptake outer membrane protein n=1 Tax=Chitinophaga hostae TaxID=2831022 RepID=A0ABS5IXV7_9BACT|nr:RagB/SusD family nutrient uptake outer membrane protein [Chitinophaga hostae]MBS0027796.1 RagB/SusD family nutrient uptake outer membrane protein [Chitinophaga hostae]